MEEITNKDPILKRLRRIEGQIKGIQKMVGDEKSCGDILTQISAARAALNKVGGLILEHHMKDCLTDYLDNSEDDKDLDELIEIMIKYTK
ncbi:metal-sensitive transcriptional regulator [Sporosalibacterium faouarense]|uniref:metal-sensitive transcriptional regulator n=1 Tax=Sporosalibacterium faouarense TaxID=516123 RepID=UPI00141C3049|nr:metal-sensitive transcriptional regulator [Sporosalibacterium faouarense]MTI47774.1 metal-sensitive transcriptional regulator [Bacillota bacterium]